MCKVLSKSKILEEGRRRCIRIAVMTVLIHPPKVSNGEAEIFKASQAVDQSIITYMTLRIMMSFAYKCMREWKTGALYNFMRKEGGSSDSGAFRAKNEECQAFQQACGVCSQVELCISSSCPYSQLYSWSLHGIIYQTYGSRRSSGFKLLWQNTLFWT